VTGPAGRQRRAVIRFEVSQIQVRIAGPQPREIDATITTRHRRARDLLTVSLGALVVYCYDLPAVRVFATAWRSAMDYTGPLRLPETIRPGINRVAIDRNHAGILLRIAGAPSVHRLNGVPAHVSFESIPHVRVEIGRLIVRAYDVTAVRSWAAAWADAEQAALRIWPDPDSFDQAENATRARIARRATTRRTATERPG